MQFTTALLGLLAASTTAFAAPADLEAKLMTAVASKWTVTDFTRSCNGGDTSCHVSFGVNRNDGSAVQKCSYDVTGAPASKASYNSVACGAYTISSGWSGQFGADAGFSTLAVTDAKQIIYPAYTDKQLVNGQVVKPDQSYAPQALP
ncbi:hypothetical protein SLS55_009587 [Diplodia seriata]|uniref:Putative surface protein 1 n=1 Tax=Diplodia seriata TaxID=420778 RepID=A0A0G2GTP8_9PEZI|nr:putative surface protein 1 [Diplodia seriata]OMP81656.1 hypothetical protein BK809_0002649 [Diplodia seriata]